MDFFDAVDTQYVACGRTGKFVGAVAGADGDGQGINAGVAHEAGSVFHAGEHLVVREFADSSYTVFFTGFTGFQIAQYADFAFYRYAAGMGEFDHSTGGFHVVFIAGRGFAVFHQRAVHHHG